jgi:hypothetical protein
MPRRILKTREESPGPRTGDHVIAATSFRFDKHNVRFRPFQPRASGRDGVCWFEFSRGRHRYADRAFGVDGLQSLLLALVNASSWCNELYPSTESVGEQTSPLPLIVFQPNEKHTCRLVNEWSARRRSSGLASPSCEPSSGEIPDRRTGAPRRMGAPCAVPAGDPSHHPL